MIMPSPFTKSFRRIGQLGQIEFERGAVLQKSTDRESAGGGY